MGVALQCVGDGAIGQQFLARKLESDTAYAQMQGTSDELRHDNVANSGQVRQPS